jgi:YVTN family beta-propeller protein
LLLAAAVLLARDVGAPTVPTTPPVPLAANHAVRIDPGSLQADAAVAVGSNPAAVVGGGGLVWVANRRDGTVTVIDPGTNRTQETIPASGSWPVGQGGPGLAYAGGSVWVTNARQRQVARVELGGDPTPIPVGASPRAVAAAPNADIVWVAGRTRSGGGLLARIDARTNQVDLTIPLPQAPSGLAVTADGGTVWLVIPKDQTLRSFDTRTGEQGEPVRLRLAPDQVALGDGAVWVTSSSSDTVLRVDPATSKAEEIRVGNGPGGIVFGADRVWVANSQDGTVSAIDPQTNRVATRRLGFRPAAVAVVAEQRAVWVALAA